jgi:DNA polymerase sigma
MLKQKWPEAKVSLFGSAASQLAMSRVKDIDGILELGGVENSQKAKGMGL